MVWTTQVEGKTVCIYCKKPINHKPLDGCPKEHQIVYSRALEDNRKREKGNNSFHQKKYAWKVKKAVIKMMGGKCIRCGIKDIRVLTINHKDGNGHEEKKISKHIWRDIYLGRRKTDDLDLMCFNHNVIYEYEIGRLKVTE